MKKMLNEGNQTHNFISSSVSGTVINDGSGSDFLTSYISGSGSSSQKVTVPMVPVPASVPQQCSEVTPLPTAVPKVQKLIQNFIPKFLLDLFL